METETRSVDVEVLPQDAAGVSNLFRGDSQALPRLVAFLMDNLFNVPGTKWKFGLNPLMDLVPGIGDAAAAVVSALTLYVAAQRRVPKIVLARMALNILLNSAMGILPGVGEAFALWFRPSQRNYDLLRAHLSADGPKKPAAHHWLFVAGLIGAVLLVFILCVALGAWVFLLVFHAVSRMT
jgi:hypothetical protein